MMSDKIVGVTPKFQTIIHRDTKIFCQNTNKISCFQCFLTKRERQNLYYNFFQGKKYKIKVNHGHLKVRPNILPTQIRVEQVDMGQTNQQVIIIDPSRTYMTEFYFWIQLLGRSGQFFPFIIQGYNNSIFKYLNLSNFTKHGYF